MKTLTKCLIASQASCLAAIAASFCSGATIVAQSVSPVIMEYHSAATSGSFDLTNDSMQTLVVTIEPRSFSIDRNGNGQFRPLDVGMRVSFSETSVRLMPKSRRKIFYKASAEIYPAWFSIYACFRGLPRQNGMNVQLELPHTVYLLGDAKKSKPARGDLAFEDLRVTDGVLTGVIHNKSAKMLRVDDMDALEPGHGKTTVCGFPLLPGGVRDFQIKLPHPENAESAKLIAHYGNVSLESMASR